MAVLEAGLQLEGPKGQKREEVTVNAWKLDLICCLIKVTLPSAVFIGH